jgi:hypothetical protein
MTHDDQPDLQRAQAQLDRAVDALLTTTQALARQQQTFALLQRISPEVAQRIGRSLFDQMPWRVIAPHVLSNGTQSCRRPSRDTSTFNSMHGNANLTPFEWASLAIRSR